MWVEERWLFDKHFTARMCYSEHSRAARWHVFLSQFFWSSHISWLTCHVDSSLSDGCDFHIAQQDQHTFIALISASLTEEVTFISLSERKDVRRCWVTNCTSCWTENLIACTFFCLVSVPHLIALPHAHACGSRPRHDWDGLHVCAPAYKSSTLTACFIDHSSTCLTHFHHSVPHHLSRHRTHC